MHVRSHSPPSLTTFFLASATEMLKNKIDKMSLIGNWHTKNIDQVNLTFSVVSSDVRSKSSIIHNRHKVLISRFVEIAKITICSKL